MRPKKLLALPVILAGLAGCATKPSPDSGLVRPADSPAAVRSTKSTAAPAPDAPVPLRRVVTAYLEGADDINSRFHEDVALALQDGLRRQNFDVRGSILADARTTASSAVATLLDNSRASAGGVALPPTLRAATYLHANSPRVVLVATLSRGTPPAKSGAATQLVLAGFLCDTQTGTVLWSNRAETTAARAAGEALDSARAREIVDQFLGSMPHPPAGNGNGNSNGSGG